MKIRDNTRMIEDLRRRMAESENENLARSFQEDESARVSDIGDDEIKQKLIAFATLTVIFGAFVILPLIFLFTHK